MQWLHQTHLTQYNYDNLPRLKLASVSKMKSLEEKLYELDAILLRQVHVHSKVINLQSNERYVTTGRASRYRNTIEAIGQWSAWGETFTQVRRIYIRSNLLSITWLSGIHSSPGHQALERLFGLGQADGVVANVIDTVPAAQERVTEDGQGANGLGEVHAHEAANAGTLDLQDVVKGADLEGVTSQSEGKVRQGVTLSAVHGVLAVPALGGANLLVPTMG